MKTNVAISGNVSACSSCKNSRLIFQTQDSFLILPNNSSTN